MDEKTLFKAGLILDNIKKTEKEIELIDNITLLDVKVIVEGKYTERGTCITVDRDDMRDYIIALLAIEKEAKLKELRREFERL